LPYLSPKSIIELNTLYKILASHIFYCIILLFINGLLGAIDFWLDARLNETVAAPIKGTGKGIRKNGI